MRDDVKALIDTVSGWPQIAAEPHRFGGTEFQLGTVEIGHVHSNGLVDIPFTRRLREALVSAGEAELHHVLPESGWISFTMRADGDTAQALRLMRLSYLQKARRRDTSLTADAVQAELDRLGFGAAVNRLLVRASRDVDEGKVTE
jgi:hypothetical protein